MDFVKILQRFGLSRLLIFKLGEGRAKAMISDFGEYLKPAESLLDVGAGTGNVDILLMQAGFKVAPLDIQNLSFSDKIQPVIYNGKKMPFKDNQFDVSLILTVLHHIKDPEPVLQEAARVAKRVIITEDIYVNIWQKHATFLLDSLLNLEFKGHPHSNRTDEQWKATFKKMGLKLMQEKSMTALLVLRQKIYVLEK